MSVLWSRHLFDASELLARRHARTGVVKEDITETYGAVLGCLPVGRDASTVLDIGRLDSYIAYAPQTSAELQTESQHEMERNLERQRKNEEYQRELLAWKKLPFLKRLATRRPTKKGPIE